MSDIDFDLRVGAPSRGTYPVLATVAETGTSDGVTTFPLDKDQHAPRATMRRGSPRSDPYIRPIRVTGPFTLSSVRNAPGPSTRM